MGLIVVSTCYRFYLRVFCLYIFFEEFWRCVYYGNELQRKSHLFLLVIGVVIFICVVFDATAMFRCDAIKLRAVNCLAFIGDVAIGTLLGRCCCIWGSVCCGWLVGVWLFTLTFRICC